MIGQAKKDGEPLSTIFYLNLLRVRHIVSAKNVEAFRGGVEGVSCLEIYISTLLHT